MEILLRNDFTAHYGLPISETSNISISTTAQYFEIEDDEYKETQLHFIVGGGMAAYKNTNSYDIIIINYDKFITGLPHVFQRGKERCDLIVHTTNLHYFLLNELKDRKLNNKVRAIAISQLLSSLELIMNVPTIITFAKAHKFRHCCFFNKPAVAPPNTSIKAPAAFGRLNRLTSGGLKMSNPAIEAFGFELWEYSGNQVYNL